MKDAVGDHVACAEATTTAADSLRAAGAALLAACVAVVFVAFVAGRGTRDDSIRRLTPVPGRLGRFPTLLTSCPAWAD